MILYLALLLVQITCIVDVIRNGRNQLWIMALMPRCISGSVRADGVSRGF